MGYIVNQYNKNDNEDVSKFMSFILEGEPIRIPEQSDNGIIGMKVSNPFFNEGIMLKSNVSFEASKNYYFHSKIRRMNETQVFHIYLANVTKTDNNTILLAGEQQFLKTITVQGGTDTDWVDMELIFAPFINFNTIMFKLQRSIVDYNLDTCRYPTIIYQELSIINNLLSSFSNVQSLYKLGVQSRPGFLMCINGEEIRTGRSGIYELKDGFIMINFFSAVAAAEDPVELKDELTKLPSTLNNSSCVCLFDKNKTRTIDNFSLDYVYKNI